MLCCVLRLVYVTSMTARDISDITSSKTFQHITDESLFLNKRCSSDHNLVGSLPPISSNMNILTFSTEAVNKEPPQEANVSPLVKKLRAPKPVTEESLIYLFSFTNEIKVM